MRCIVCLKRKAKPFRRVCKECARTYDSTTGDRIVVDRKRKRG